MRILLFFLLFRFLTTIAMPSEDIPLEVLRVQKNSHKAYQVSPNINKIHTYAARQKIYPHFTFIPGSLKENIVQLARQSGWATVVWQPDYDYTWVGTSRFRNLNVKEVLATVLKDFPLQAIFYQGNHVLVIAPRNIQ